MLSQQRGIVVDGVLTVACPAVACLMMSFVAHGTRAVSSVSPAFQIMVNGAIVGVLAFAARRWRSAGLYTAAILLTVGMLAFASRLSTRIAVHTIILMVALTCVTSVSMRCLARRSRSSFLRTFLTWVATSAVFYFLAGVVLLVLFQAANLSAYVRLYARLSVALGLGLGLGFAIRDRVEPIVLAKVMPSENSQGRKDSHR